MFYLFAILIIVQHQRTCNQKERNSLKCIPIEHTRIGVRPLARKEVSDDFKVFSERLSLLMKEGNLKQKDLADYLGIKRQTVSLYMTGQSIPDAEQLKNIANFFDVSADWLLGLSNLTHIRNNEETARSLQLPERFVSELRFILNQQLAFEIDALMNLLSSDGFWEAIQALSSAAAESIMVGKDVATSKIPNRYTPEVKVFDEKVRELTDKTFCVCSSKSMLDGLKFRAQESFNRSVESYLHDIQSEQELQLYKE